MENKLICELLDKIELLRQAPNQIEHYIARSFYARATALVVDSIALLFGDELRDVMALLALQSELLQYKNRLVDLLMGELRTYLYAPPEAHATTSALVKRVVGAHRLSERDAPFVVATTSSSSNIAGVIAGTAATGTGSSTSDKRRQGGSPSSSVSPRASLALSSSPPIALFSSLSQRATPSLDDDELFVDLLISALAAFDRLPSTVSTIASGMATEFRCAVERATLAVARLYATTTTTQAASSATNANAVVGGASGGGSNASSPASSPASPSAAASSSSAVASPSTAASTAVAASSTASSGGASLSSLATVILAHQQNHSAIRAAGGTANPMLAYLSTVDASVWFLHPALSLALREQLAPRSALALCDALQRQFRYFEDVLQRHLVVARVLQNGAQTVIGARSTQQQSSSTAAAANNDAKSRSPLALFTAQRVWDAIEGEVYAFLMLHLAPPTVQRATTASSAASLDTEVRSPPRTCCLFVCCAVSFRNSVEFCRNLVRFASLGGE